MFCMEFLQSILASFDFFEPVLKDDTSPAAELFRHLCTSGNTEVSLGQR